MEWSHGPPAKKEPPKEEYKPETDPYQPEYETQRFLQVDGHVTVEFFRQIKTHEGSVSRWRLYHKIPKNHVKPNQRKIT